MNKKNGTPKGTTQKDNAILQELINASQGTSYSKWLRVVWNNQGIPTNELSLHGLDSNNHHNASQKLNPRIEPFGWRINKRVKTQRNKSHGWYLEPITVKAEPQLELNLDGEVVQ